jgi:hypothetical protein
MTEKTTSASEIPAKSARFPAAVAAIVSPTKVVINRGQSHGINMGQRFLIYELSEEQIVDPVTGEQLGYLETYKGTGKVVHLQEKMAIVESDQPGGGFGLLDITSKKPFDQPRVGDKAQPI